LGQGETDNLLDHRDLWNDTTNLVYQNFHLLKKKGRLQIRIKEIFQLADVTRSGHGGEEKMSRRVKSDFLASSHQELARMGESQNSLEREKVLRMRKKKR